LVEKAYDDGVKKKKAAAKDNGVAVCDECVLARRRRLSPVLTWRVTLSTSRWSLRETALPSLDALREVRCEPEIRTGDDEAGVSGATEARERERGKR